MKRRKNEEVVDPLAEPFPLLPPLLLEVVAETVVLVVMVVGAIVVVELLLLFEEEVLFNERPIRLDLRSITDTFCDSLRHCKTKRKCQSKYEKYNNHNISIESSATAGAASINMQIIFESFETETETISSHIFATSEAIK